MAQQPSNKVTTEWKLGAKCDFFDRGIRQWVEAEVIGSFSDDKGEWIKVRCGQKDHNVMSDDPDLRKRTLISGNQLKLLQDAVAQIPTIAPVLDNILPSSSGQGLHALTDSWAQILFHIFASFPSTDS